MSWRLLHGDCIAVMSEIEQESVQACVTSPPYWGLRDYGRDGQIGLEGTIDAYVSAMVSVFDAVWRVLRDDGVVWLNLGDTYAGGSSGKVNNASSNLNGGLATQAAAASVVHRRQGVRTKNLCGIPWRVALALQSYGWTLRQCVIWHKPNAMPEPVRDRPSCDHEYIFLLSKSSRYYYDGAAIGEQVKHKRSGAAFGCGCARIGARDGSFVGSGGRKYAGNVYNSDSLSYKNKRSVWSVCTKPHSGAHFAVMPEGVATPCVLSGSAVGDLVMDPFSGSATVGAVAVKNGRNYVGIDLNEEYIDLARERLSAAEQSAGVANRLTPGQHVQYGLFGCDESGGVLCLKT